MNAIERALHDAHRKFQRQSGAVDTDTRKRVIVFKEPTSDTWIKQHRTFRPKGYYRLHCSHDRPLWMICATCKRSTREARDNFVLLLSGKLL